MFNSNGPSLSDIAAVTRNSNNDGFGGGNGWWVLIILLALFGGWGNGWGRNGNGFGGGDNGYSPTPYATSSVTQADLQRGFDTQGITNKLNGLEQGLCSLGYDQLAQINNVVTAINQVGTNIQGSITQMGINQMQDMNNLSRQLADCCCQNREAISKVLYELASGNCNITNAINQAAQTIVQNSNNNYRALHDEFVQSQLAQKDAKIAEQASLINALNLTASQKNQTAEIVSLLRNSNCCGNTFNG